MWILGLQILLGLAASGYYFSWWSHGGRITVPWLAVALALTALYHWSQVFAGWVVYLAAGRKLKPCPPHAEAGVTIDVFVTACNEEFALIEKALRAAVNMRVEHKTWLLDDGSDPRLAEMAAGLGAGYLTREGSLDAKAGNLNAGLARTDSDIVVIFDIDHVPDPDFLEKSVGYFADPQIGFVQVMLTFDNTQESWIARAAAESALDFYNPVSKGMDGLGSATLIGSNALIRRSALESIGGYRPGLAEDLATSIALHAEGWKSRYVAEPLAPGLAPANLHSWFVQQKKWARGVFELLLTDYPRFFWKLTAGQRLSYILRMTYYWVGLVACVHLLFTVIILVLGHHVARVDFLQYIIHAAPLVFLSLLIRVTALRQLRHPRVPFRLFWRAGSLVYFTWPIYFAAWLMAVCRYKLPFAPTPKTKKGRQSRLVTAPQTAALLCLLTSVGYLFSRAAGPELVILAIFAGMQILPYLVVNWYKIR